MAREKIQIYGYLYVDVEKDKDRQTEMGWWARTHNCCHPGEWYIVQIFLVSIGLKCLKCYEERWEGPYPLERHTEMIINK